MGEETVAARLLQNWARGLHATPSERAHEVLRKRVIFCSSWKGTSYSSILDEKDFVRSENLVWLFFEQFVLEVMSGARMSEEHEDIGKGLAFLPIWRGYEQMAQEYELELKGVDVEYKKAVALKPLLPSAREGYEDQYLAMQELALPVNTRFECEQYIESAEWEPLRHALRRESLRAEVKHPFEHLNKKEPIELFEMLPLEVQRYVENCPACEGIENLRIKFTRAIVFWSGYYEDLKARKSTTGSGKRREGEWHEHTKKMDEYMRSKKARIMAAFEDEEETSREEEDTARSASVPSVPSECAE